MHTFVRWASAALLFAACGGDGRGAASTAPPPITTSPVTTDPAVTTPVMTTVPHTTPSSPTDASAPVTSTEFVSPVAINNEGDVVLAYQSVEQSGQQPPDVTTRLMIVDTKTGARRQMPDGGLPTTRWAVGLNDAGVLAGSVVTGTGPCTSGIQGIVMPSECPVTAAFVWDSVGGDIATLPGWMAMAGPNSAGLVVVSRDPDGPYVPDGDQMSVWDTTTDELTTVNGLALYSGEVFLNDRGQVLGMAAPDVVVWDVQTDRVEVLGDAAGGRATTLVGLDNSGRAVARDDSGFSGVFVWQPSDRQWQQLVTSDGTPPMGTSASTVSGGGLVAGSTYGTALDDSGRPIYAVDVWDLGSGLRSERLALGDLRYADPVGINDVGQILAWGEVVDRSIPYLYDPRTDTWTELCVDGAGTSNCTLPG